MKKIVRIRDINDITLAFLMLGLAETIFGSTMALAGLYSYSKEIFLTNIMIDAIIHGSALSLNGVVLMALCLMSVFFAVSKNRVDVLWVLAIASVVVSFVGIIRGMVDSANGFSLLFSLLEIVICSIVLFIVSTTKRFLERRSRQENYSWSCEMVLKKVS